MTTINHAHTQLRPKAPPVTQNASEKPSGDKHKEVTGTKFTIVATREGRRGGGGRKGREKVASWLFGGMDAPAH